MTQRWLIIGAGVSGLGAAKLLRKNGYHVRVSDNKALTKQASEKFRILGVELLDKGHDPSHLTGVDAVVISPGLPNSHPLIVAAHAKGLRVVSEIDLALENYSGTLIGVTGTNGKSTTCAMLGHVFSRAKADVTVGGNFGDPPSAMLAEGRARTLMILELSSYQLEGSALVHPKVAIFTSFSHDHMARHGSLKGYLAAKWKIFQKSSNSDLALIPHEIVALAEQYKMPLSCPTLRFYTSTDEMGRIGKPGFTLHQKTLALSSGEQISLEGASLQEFHNLQNAAFSLLALRHILGVSLAESADFLSDFCGLPHRCESIKIYNGRRIVNDSKSTNVESTLVALKSQTHPVILMMGGQGKSEPYTPILEQKHRISALITFGASEAEIARDLEAHIPTFRFSSLKSALCDLRSIVDKYNSGVLFSPGCASFDEFENYEHRGDIFRAYIERDFDVS